MGRRKASSRPALRGGSLTLAEYGMPDLPAFSFDTLPGDTIRDKATAYVAALGMEPTPRSGMVAWRVECALDDWQRARDGRPSYEEEILADL